MFDILTIDEAKEYMRVDYSDEDALIGTFIQGAQTLCRDVARLSSDDWDNIVNGEDERKGQLKIAVLYALAYLSEHREEADHHELLMTLRSLLFSFREGVL